MRIVTIRQYYRGKTYSHDITCSHVSHLSSTQTTSIHRAFFLSCLTAAQRIKWSVINTVLQLRNGPADKFCCIKSATAHGVIGQNEVFWKLFIERNPRDSVVECFTEVRYSPQLAPLYTASHLYSEERTHTAKAVQVPLPLQFDVLRVRNNGLS